MIFHSFHQLVSPFQAQSIRKTYEAIVKRLKDTAVNQQTFGANEDKRNGW